MSSQKIICQSDSCLGEKGGCSFCGGSGVVLERRSACVVCKRKAWFRRDVSTGFDGKQFRSIDNVELVWRKNGARCRECDHHIVLEGLRDVSNNHDGGD